MFGWWNMLRRWSPEKLPDTSRVPRFSSKNKQKKREKVPLLMRIFAFFTIDFLSIDGLWLFDMAKKPDLLPGTLEMLILKTLTRGPMHGYGIAAAIKRVSDDVLTVEEGSLYPALQRLLLQGWVKAQWKMTETNRRARYYTLTPEGQEQLEQETGRLAVMMEAIWRVMMQEG
jgi:PadR family transcriptional regulator PadR